MSTAARTTSPPRARSARRRSCPPRRSTSSPSCTARFEPRRQELLAARARARRGAADGGTLDFLAGDERDPRGRLAGGRRRRRTTRDRRVEITGPTDRKLVINALNSGARGFMADFEDANSPDVGQPWSSAT